MPTTTIAIRQYLTERTPLDQEQQTHPSTLPLFARHDKRAGSHVLAISRWTVANIITFWAKTLIPDSNQPASAEITPTTLRHFFVISTLNKTHDLLVTQQRARHKDRGTTRQYLPQDKSPNST